MADGFLSRWSKRKLVRIWSLRKNQPSRLRRIGQWP
jgi:hypothetical protein